MPSCPLHPTRQVQNSQTLLSNGQLLLPLVSCMRYSRMFRFLNQQHIFSQSAYHTISKTKERCLHGAPLPHFPVSAVLAVVTVVVVPSPPLLPVPVAKHVVVRCL